MGTYLHEMEVTTCPGCDTVFCPCCLSEVEEVWDQSSEEELDPEDEVARYLEESRKKRKFVDGCNVDDDDVRTPRGCDDVEDPDVMT